MVFMAQDWCTSCANQSIEDEITLAVLFKNAQRTDVPARLRLYEKLRIARTRQVREGSREAGALYRSTELSPDQQSQRTVAIYDRSELETYDAERVALDALVKVD